MTTNPSLLAREGKIHRTKKHEHLIFSNCVANFGSGVLLLEITRWNTNRKTATVRQLIEDDTTTDRGRWKKRLAGGAEFDSNPDHDHWHYADFLIDPLRRLQVKSRRNHKTRVPVDL